MAFELVQVLVDLTRRIRSIVLNIPVIHVIATMCAYSHGGFGGDLGETLIGKGSRCF